MPLGEKQEHESFGMLGFCRTTSSGEKPLFGSSIKHRDTIVMKVKTASIERSLNQDWYFGGRNIVEVEMSQTQFAEAITSMNCGDGVPVTIRYIGGDKMDDCPFENKRTQFEDEFRKQMQELSSKLDSLVQQTTERLADKKPLNVKEREELAKQINRFKMEIGSNIPFVYSQFNEQMDKTVKEAKGEIDAFVLNKVTSLGLEKIEELKMLGANK